MREQKGLNATTFTRRASLPPEQRSASYHRAGTRAGVHSEDRASFTTNRNRFHAPATDAYIEVDEEDEDAYTRPPTRSSARRYDLAPYAHRGEQRTEELPRQGKHPLFYIGICLLIMVLFLMAYTFIPQALQKWHDDSTYGYPRTFQIDANVGHDGVSHFIAFNKHGTIEVVEIPADPTKTQARLYLITHFAGQGADLIPATISFSDVNGDGKLDMVVTVYNGPNPTVYFLFNNGTTFVPKL